ncbi:polysaccharide biosynthesis tyrosine autokinase [Pelagicoccus sp. NFK12]|uniref:Polysaccharide biosynthesis tyrosine autokinase n=1 Tax=Pelagicoccus enzymogenes TaxID=2773457 RepID=A0A927FD35_9BACT|nr:polysaccharide biosynthesis tyrosine autokinase [Pelagicoccus enzymogenes]MBD5781203.1 polysaccharide biosynthesis tyrosine autokinase [Pelagicoccus enzymogenes]MDQ8198895.1 polysaccharide biosynthesis tyrosine autokinase [Pelagicoccus enzymogenes]
MIIRKRWVSAFLAAALVGGTLYFFFGRTVPEYTAVSTMLAQSPLDELLKINGNESVRKDVQENFLHNHLSVMQSRRFSVAISKAITDEEKQRIAAPLLNDGETLTEDRFINMIASRSGAERQRDREFFTLRYTHRDPEVAVLVANRMTATYLELVQDEIKETNKSVAQILNIQSKQLQDEITQLEESQREFRDQHNISSMEEEDSFHALRLERLNKSLTETRIRKFDLESKLKEAKRDLAVDGQPFENLYLANFANNQALRQSLDALNAERSVLALKYGRMHPKMLEIDGKIKGVNQNISRNFELGYRDIESQFLNLVAMEQRLDREFNDVFKKGIEMGRLSAQLLLIDSEIEAKREALKELQRRANQAEVVSNLPKDVMRVIDPAFIVRPKLSKEKVTLMIIGCLAFGAFVTMPLSLHLFDQRIKVATDIEQELGKPLVGGVPRISRLKARDKARIVSDDLGMTYVEPFMALIAQVELMSRQSGCKSFVIASAVKAEGKSTISTNLADGFVRLGRKTLLIDCDLRKPGLQQFHSVEKEKGLIWWGEAGCPMENVLDDSSPLGIHQLDSGTYMLPAGGVSKHPSQLLVSDAFDKLFEVLSEAFDVILVDTPPVGLYPDAQLLAKYVGETLFVARESCAPVAQIRRVIMDIENTAAPVLGIILNCYSPGSFNPRLAYRSNYEKYEFDKRKKAREKELTRAKKGGNSLVSKLMADKENRR